MRASLAAGHDPAAGRREVLADLCAGTVSRLPAPDQSLACLVDKRLHLFLAHSQHRRDLGLRVVAELEQNQSGSLVKRQALHILEQLAQLLPPLKLL